MDSYRDNVRWISAATGGLSIAIFLVAWGILSYGRLVQPYFLPTPSAVLREVVIMFRQGHYIGDIAVSLSRVLVSFFLCTLSAVPLGILMGRVKSISAFFNPFIVFMRYVPISAFIPLLILWTGIGNFQKIVFLWMGTFFFLVALIADAAASVQREFLETAYTLGARKYQILYNVVLPAALPVMLDSLRVMMSVGWTYLVLAEIVAAESGIGYVIMESQRFLKTPRVVAGILTVGLIGIALDWAFRGFRLLLFPWLRPHV